MVNKKRHPGTSNKQAKGSARAIQTWAFVAFHQPRTFEEKQTTDLVSRYFEYTVIFRELKTGKSFGKQVQYRKENSLPYDKLAVHERPFRIYMIWLVHD